MGGRRVNTGWVGGSIPLPLLPDTEQKIKTQAAFKMQNKIELFFLSLSPKKEAVLTSPEH